MSKITNTGVHIVESADAIGDVAGEGQIWVDNQTPNRLMFTNDAGTDKQIDGGWSFVSSATASSSATISFTGMEAGYDHLITITGVQPATDNQQLKALLGVTTPTYRTSGYLVTMHYLVQTTTNATAAGTANIMMTGDNVQSNATDEVGRFELTLYDNAAATDTFFKFEGDFINNGSAQTSSFGGGTHTTAEAMTAVQFLYTSGNISIGKFKLYRRANA